MDLSLLSAPELVEEIGGRVRRERLRQNLSQHTLAERAGVSRLTVTRLTVTRLEAGTSTTLTNFVSVLVALRRSGDLDQLMSPVEILYEGEAGTWIVGRAAQRGSTTFIEYTDEHLARNVELAPVHHRRDTKARIFEGRSPEHLPGLLSDVVPDAWGQLVVGRDMRQHGIDQASALQMLTWLGRRTMGALTFRPVEGPQTFDTGSRLRSRWSPAETRCVDDC